MISVNDYASGREDISPECITDRSRPTTVMIPSKFRAHNRRRPMALINRAGAQVTFKQLPRPLGPRSLHFVKFLQHGRGVASLAPSSRKLAAAACRHVSTDRPQVIVELGAGAGPITGHAVSLMHPRSRLIAIEQDPDLAAFTQRLAPAAEVICGDAGDIGQILADRQIGHVDLIINGLPTPSLPPAITGRLLRWIDGLQGSALMSQITVMPWVYLRMYRALFERVDFELVWANIPPGGVYHCYGLKPQALADS